MTFTRLVRNNDSHLSTYISVDPFKLYLGDSNARDPSPNDQDIQVLFGDFRLRLESEGKSGVVHQETNQDSDHQPECSLQQVDNTREKAGIV